MSARDRRRTRIETLEALVLMSASGAANLTDLSSTPIPVEPDGGIGDGAIPLSDPLNQDSIPVEPDGGIGDGAIPLSDLLNQDSIPVEPDGGIGDGAGPLPSFEDFQGFPDDPEFFPVDPDEIDVLEGAPADYAEVEFVLEESFTGGRLFFEEVSIVGGEIWVLSVYEPPGPDVGVAQVILPFRAGLTVAAPDLPVREFRVGGPTFDTDDLELVDRFEELENIDAFISLIGDQETTQLYKNGVDSPNFRLVTGLALPDGPIPVEPDGGIGDGAGPLPGFLPDGTPILPGEPIPVEPDGGIGDGAPPLPDFLADGPIPVEPDGGIGDGAPPLPDLIFDGPIPVEPDGGIGDGAPPLTDLLNDQPIPVEPNGGIGDGAVPLTDLLEAGAPTVGIPIPVEPDGGIGDGATPLTDLLQDLTTSAASDAASANQGGAGTASVNAINGTDAGEWISGTESDDAIYAGGGDDEIHNPFGNNTIDGGDGFDTLVIYEGSSTDFTVVRLNDGSYRVEGIGLNGQYVRQTLSSVERIVFNDREILLSDVCSSDTTHPQSASDVPRNGNWYGGTAGDDSVSGSDENDEFHNPLGSNDIDGGSGVDKLLIYEGVAADYSLSRTSDDKIVVEGPGLNGTTVLNRLTDVEMILFNDQVVLTSSIT